ncbi:TRAP transporter small permease [Colwellia sp. UCD-KL20]|uniref:TRAP transporter small permease n=1 Tax=Colwellia sp. UCD-KL20 TaxID=1917165 RepID=UPI000970C032|nr:TRAP transporter small permease [Colwellia sp. UCD-KL20]
MLDWINKHLENVIAIVLFVVMTIAVFTQILTRTFDYSLSWTEELARYCLIWLVFIGTSLAVIHQQHINIDVISKRLNESEKKVLAVIAQAIFFAFSLVILFYSTQMVIDLYRLDQHSPALGLPMWIVYLACPVGFALTAFRLLQQIVNTVETTKTEMDK